tara:strand:- start:466 stop:732 length:267 start_codon:yes stop_codon:yes gene_type:complete
MQITKIIADQVTTGTNAGAATTIGGATCVRLVNTHTGDVVVAVSTQVGAATTTYFTMVTDTTEFIQKKGTDVIWTDTGIPANKVAFTN